MRKYLFLLLSLLVVATFLMELSSCTGVTGQAAGTQFSAVNHVVIMLQENRSFDSYFGKLNDYLQANGYPQAGQVVGIPAAGFSNVSPTGQVITSYHSGSECMENLSPDWAEDHKEVNLSDPAAASPTTAPMDGFVNTAAGISQFYGFIDTSGHRAMGYYTDQDLNYYYFLAANFATSDRFFSPVPTNTTNNRLYMFAATSQGTVHTPGGDESCPGEITQLNAQTIWELLSRNNISWKIYISDPSPVCGNTSPACLALSTYLQFFAYGSTAEAQSHMATINDYFNDVKNGTLPAVSFIETGSFSGRDEHPSGKDLTTGVQTHINIQTGAQYVSTIVNALMNSPSWKDTVFFWAFDEGGGAFDHVPPMSVPNPDGIQPVLCLPKDTAVGGDFTMTGFRVPMLVISPFTRKNFVSHTPMDYTALLTFIEARFKLPNLTKRDATMPNMSEFFDFANAPWATPPTPPAQNTSGVCDFTQE